jgi:dTMP kinase
MKNKFIVIEGIDGCGKTTVVNKLKNELNDQFVFVKDPSGTALADFVSDWIHDPTNIDKAQSDIGLYLLMASRVDMINNLIKPALRDGKTVICDRFLLSTFVYQWSNENQDLFKILDSKVNDLVSIDSLLFLDIDPKIAKDRRCKRITNDDGFDKLSISYFEELRNRYKKFITESEYHAVGKDKYIIDASKSIDEVYTNIKNLILKNG